MTTRQYQIHTEPVSTSPETVTESRWHQPLSEPVRFARNKLLAVALIASGGVIDPTSMTVPGVAQVMPWFSALSEPKRFKPALPAREHQSFALVEAAPFYETPQLDKWYIPLSEPKRFKPRLQDASQQHLAYIGADPFPESVSLDRWHIALSEPKRFKKRLETHSQRDLFFSYWLEPVQVSEWFENLSTPVRYPKRLHADNNPSFVIGIPPIVWVDSYYIPLSEPKRFPQAPVNTGTQHFLVYVPSTFTTVYTIDGAGSDIVVNGKGYDVTINGAPTERHLTVQLALT